MIVLRTGARRFGVGRILRELFEEKAVEDVDSVACCLRPVTLEVPAQHRSVVERLATLWFKSIAMP